MATWVERHWEASDAPSRRGRRSGTYSAYVPDRVFRRHVQPSIRVRQLAAEAERAVRALSEIPGVADFAGVSSLLLRADAAASSKIEGVVPGARQVAFAELAVAEDLRGISDQARLVAANIAIVKEATSQLAVREVSVADLVALQRELLNAEPRLHGLRTEQNWIGGSSWHPFEAVYVPPPPEHVDGLMADLAAFVNARDVAPLIQAAIAYAQLETIHPFPDGNGRVGRTLVHLILRRRGLTDRVFLPISSVLMTRPDAHFGGLVSYRYEGDPNSTEARDALDAWLEVFLQATIAATHEARAIAGEIESLRAAWATDLRNHRETAGLRESPRAGSAVARILGGLCEVPALTATTAHRVWGVSEPAAHRALAELRDAGILQARSDRGVKVYYSPDLMDLVTHADRRLASPVFDTAQIASGRPAPARPERAVKGSEVEQDARDWSDVAWSIWGKTDPATEGWLPLVRHLEDSAAVAGFLWDHWLPDAVKRIISDQLPGGIDDGRILTTFCAGIHDVGKAAPGFAVKATMHRSDQPDFSDLVDGMRRNGLEIPTYTSGGYEKLPLHGVIGQVILTDWLKARGFSKRDADTFGVVVGGHHGIPPSNAELLDLKGNRWAALVDPHWGAVRDEILQRMAEQTGAAERLSSWTELRLTPTVQVILTGLVVVADWLASDASRFPYDDLRPSVERVQDAGLEADLLQPWAPGEVTDDAKSLFTRRFPIPAGRIPRPVQQASVDAAIRAAGPTLMLLEAPMGVGKTEAALLAAEALAARTGAGGVFIGLPTMATSDAMFGRVNDWVGHLDAATQSIFLAHGKAALNEEYRGILRDSQVQGVDSDLKTAGASEAIVTSWLHGRRKGILANVVVGTIDQALFMGLKARFLVLRHLAMAGKVVIVDEVHAADVYMRRYLVRVLEWLGAYGTSVILLSATLPPATRQELVDAYRRGRDLPSGAVAADDAYPCVTVADDTAVDRRQVPFDGDSKTIRIELLSDRLEDLATVVSSAVEDGACVAVVRNTVRRAQDAYDALSTTLGDERVSLLHSQFVSVDRAAKEKRLREQFGPPEPDGTAPPRPRGHVVVGTQVLEQSLDVDFDLMITDIAPVDLVLQRAGRLHRHRRGLDEAERPESVRVPRLILTGATDWAGPPTFDAGVSAVYKEAPLLRAASLLATGDMARTIELPSDIPTLVRAAYDPELPVPVGWGERWTRADAVDEDETQRLWAKAATYRVGEPTAASSLIDWLRGPATDDETAGRAQVRDSEDGIEVVVVRRHEGQLRTLPDIGRWGDHDLGFPEQGPPPDHLAAAVASCTLRLPRNLTHPGIADRVIDQLERQEDFTGWQKSGWLQGQLVLVLDDAFNAELADRHLRYDRNRGLEVEEGGRP